MAVLAGAGTPDRAIAALAGRSHGIVTRRHLELAGLDAPAVRRRTASGSLHRRSAHVFAVGHQALTEEARLLAAVWAYGETRASVGFASAAGALAILPPPSGPVHVIAPVGSRRPGTRLHRVPLYPGDVRRLRGVPVTAPGRTLADLATSATAETLERAVHEAQVRRLLGAEEIERARRRSLRRRGGAALRALLEEIDPEVRLRSEFERRLWALLGASDLPPATFNAVLRLPGLVVEVDVAWLEHGVVAELDGMRFHGTAIARRRDGRRAARLRAAGLRLERVRWDDLERPDELLARLDPRSRRSVP